LLAPLALGGLLSAIAFGLVDEPFLVLELYRFASTDLRFFSLSYSLDLFTKDVRSTAVLGVEVTAAFLDPPLPLLYYEFKLYFRLPNNGFTLFGCYSGYSGCSTSLSFTLLKKSKLSGASVVCSSFFRGSSIIADSGNYFYANYPTYGFVYDLEFYSRIDEGGFSVPAALAPDASSWEIPFSILSIFTF